MRNRKSKLSNLNFKYIALAVLVIAALALFLFLYRNSSNSLYGSPVDYSNSSNNQLQNPSASDDKSSQTSNSASQGGAIDNQGAGTAQTPSSQWTSSESGAITLYSPTASSTLRSGGIISGTAKVGTVQYRLVDDQVGVLAQGSLSVVNGKFSGTLQFTPHSSSGKLSVFSFNGSGAEINRIEISLKLGS
jgi:hypothetical protein